MALAKQDRRRGAHLCHCSRAAGPEHNADISACRRSFLRERFFFEFARNFAVPMLPQNSSRRRSWSILLVCIRRLDYAAPLIHHCTDLCKVRNVPTR
jgi:hypothetical protein